MRPMRPARPRRGPAPQQESFNAVQALHVSIPLKPQQAPAAFPPRLAQAVKDEFAIRYLQQMGANSTPENIAMVLQHLPLEKCAVSAAWKSRGSLADTLAIDLNPKALAQTGEAPLEQGVAKQDPVSIVAAPQLTRRRQLRGQHVYEIGTVSFTFDDMKRKYLLPFKLATTPPEPDVLQLYGAHVEDDVDLADTLSPNQAELLSNTSAAPGSSTASVGRWKTQRRLNSADERSVPPSASITTVTDMHHEFYLTLPLASLGLPEGDEHMRSMLFETLVSPAMIELVQSTVQYLFLTVIHPPPTDRETRLDSFIQDALFVSIAQRFAGLRSKMERQERSTPRAQPAVLVPLLLLALRVDVETLVRLQYPTSFACMSDEMRRMLQVIDDRISQLFDPDANWSRLAVLETTFEAGQARASSSFQRARRHRRLRDQFFQTSAVLHGMFPEPSSGKCRRVMTLRGGAGIGHYPELSEPLPSTSSSATAKRDQRHLPDKNYINKNVISVSITSKLSLLRSLRRSKPSQ